MEKLIKPDDLIELKGDSEIFGPNTEITGKHYAYKLNNWEFDTDNWYIPRNSPIHITNCQYIVIPTRVVDGKITNTKEKLCNIVTCTNGTRFIACAENTSYGPVFCLLKPTVSKSDVAIPIQQVLSVETAKLIIVEVLSTHENYRYFGALINNLNNTPITVVTEKEFTSMKNLNKS